MDFMDSETSTYDLATSIPYLETDVPIVRDIDISEMVCHEFPAVVTAGPTKHEVNWGHHNHKIESFGDVTSGRSAPTIEQIRSLVEFGADNVGPILVHCHAGISRSTSTAFGIMLARGYDPNDSIRILSELHPTWNPFYPNALIVSHLETIFGYQPGVLETIVAPYRRWW